MGPASGCLWLLLFLFEQFDCIPALRVVVTFSGPSSGIEWIPWNTTLVKRYGRRLVLNVENGENLDRLQAWLPYEWPVEHVVGIEEDLPVSMSIVSSGSYLEDQYLAHSWDAYEWQFSNLEQFSTKAQTAWDMNITGTPGVIVAVIDSGLAAQAQTGAVFHYLVPGYDFVSYVETSLDGDGRDDDPTDPGDSTNDCPVDSWHGTMVATSLAAGHDVSPGFHSMAPTCTLQMLRVLGACGKGFSNDLADAIVYAAGGIINDLGYNPTPAVIISLSLAGYGSCPTYLQSAIDMATTQFGVLVVAAAGNAAGDAGSYFPANCRNVLVVGASTRRGRLAGYSNTGDLLALLAPGGDDIDPIRVLTVSSTGSLELSVSSGTSLATVYTTGMAVLYSTLSPNASGTDLVLKLLDSAWDGSQGTGILRFTANMNIVSTNWTFRETLASFLGRVGVDVYPSAVCSCSYGQYSTQSYPLCGCTQCRICPYQQYLSGCTLANAGSCVSCSICGPGFYEYDICFGSIDTDCRACEICPSGQYLLGCTGSSPGVCASCGVCDDGKYVSGCSGRNSGICSLCPACGDGQYLSGCSGINSGTCVACATDCPSGQYRSGCTGRGPGSCAVCLSCPTGKYMSGCSGLSAGSCADCTSCSNGQYLSGCSGSNAGACNSCGASCSAGSSIVGCSGTDPGTCVVCGVGSLACDTGYYRSGCSTSINGDCTLCATCSSGSYLLGCSGVTTGTCTACGACGVGEIRVGCVGLSGGTCVRVVRDSFKFDTRSGDFQFGPDGSVQYAANSIPAVLGNVTVSSGSAVFKSKTIPRGMQVWTVVTTGWYHIAAGGAAGADYLGGTGTGGRGVVVKSRVYMLAGDVMVVLVGMKPPGCAGAGFAGGGGASYVTRLTGSNSLFYVGTSAVLIGGGGGGTGGDSIQNGVDATTLTSGGQCRLAGSGAVSTIGGGGGGGALAGGAAAKGSSSDGIANGAGGGGFANLGNGGDGWTSGSAPEKTLGGTSFLGGGMGGYMGTTRGTAACGTFASVIGLPPGGFGGGGPGWNAGGGGGGYSGGQGCKSGAGNRQGGGGGGSYDVSGSGYAATIYSAWDAAMFGTAPAGYSSGYLTTDGIVAVSGLFCTAGTYASAEGVTICSTCPIGTFSVANMEATSCTSCVAGKYGGSVGVSLCLDCPAGAYTSSTGGSGCASCVAGKYNPVTGGNSFDSCLSCPPGTYSTTVASNSLSKCVSCPANTRSCRDFTSCMANAGYYIESAGTVFPPSPYMSGLTFTSGIETFTASASSYYSPTNEDSWRAFSGASTSSVAGTHVNAWTSNTGFYSGSSVGAYTGTASTVVDGNPIKGEWLQLQSNILHTLGAFSITACYGNPTRAPKSLVLAGSNDGSSWSSLVEVSDLPTWTASLTRTISMPIVAAFSGYRLIVTNTTGMSDTYLTIDKLRLYDAQVTTCAGSCTAGTTKFCSAFGTSVCCTSSQYFISGASTACVTCPANSAPDPAYQERCVANAGYYGPTLYMFDGSTYSYRNLGSKTSHAVSPVGWRPTFATVATRFGAYFDSSVNGNYYTVSNDYNTMTLAFWMYLVGPYAASGSFAQYEPMHMRSDVIPQPAEPRAFNFALGLTANVAGTGFFYACYSSCLNAVAAAGTYPVSTWKHVVLVLPSGTDRLQRQYVNGVKIVTASGTQTSDITNFQRLFVGANTIDNRYYKGYLQQLTMYNYAMTDAEAIALYNAGTPLVFTACTWTCTPPSIKRCTTNGVGLCCQPGTFFREGVDSSCQPCPAGTYSSTSATSCTLCPAGTFSLGTNEILVSECRACPANTASNASRTGCVANTGYYNLDDNLLAYYPFRPENVYTDASWNGYTLTDTNIAIYPQSDATTSPYPGAGVIFFNNPGVSFAGLAIPSSTSISFTMTVGSGLNLYNMIGSAGSPQAGFSLCFWMRGADGATAGTLNTINAQNFFTIMTGSTSPSSRVRLSVGSSGNTILMDNLVNNVNGGSASYAGRSTRYWSHKCYTIQDVAFKAYFDCSTPTCASTDNTLSTSFVSSVLYTYVTMGQGGWDTALFGWLSDVRYYKKALTPAEVFAVRSYAGTTSFSVNGANSLLAYYPFSSSNSIYNDASGNGYNLTNTNTGGYSPSYAGDTTSPFPGAGAAFFNNLGSGSGVAVTTATGSPVQAFTVPGSSWGISSFVGTSAAPGEGFSWCYWIRAVDGVTTGTGNTLDYPFVFWLGTCFCNVISTSFYGLYDGRDSSLATKGGTNHYQGGSPRGGLGPTGIYTANWVHVCFVWQGRDFRAYVNCGSSTCSASSTGTLSADPYAGSYTNIYIGQGGYGKAWHGWLSEFRFYKRALTPAEVYAVKSYDGTSQTALRSVNSGLLAYYTFSSNAMLADSSGVTGSLSATGFPFVVDDSKTDLANTVRFTQAIGLSKLSVTAAYFTIPQLTIGPAFSVCIWYNPDITMTVGSVGSSPRLIELSAAQGGGNVHIRRDSTTNNLAIEIWNGASNIISGSTAAVYTGLFQLGVWQHVCLSVSGLTGKVYYNGALQAATITLTAQKAVTTYSPGGYLANTAYDIDLYRGYLDEARIYSRALSAAEVTSIYNFRGEAYTPGVFLKCQPCLAGLYGGCNSLNVAVCSPCPAGKYNTGTGLVVSSDCPSCLAGSYSTGSGLVACSTCLAGTYSAVLGASLSSTCQSCAAGSYATGTGSGACTACLAGTYSITPAAVVSSICQPCDTGTYAAGVGLAACTPCSAGTYSTAIGGNSSLSCRMCYAGTYSTVSGAVESVSTWLMKGYRGFYNAGTSYEGYMNMMPDFNTLTFGENPIVLVGRVSMTSVNLQSVSDFVAAIPDLGTSYFAATFDGQFSISISGVYTFCVNSVDGSFLIVDGVLLVNNDNAHYWRKYCTAQQMRSGSHDLRVTYFHFTYGAGCIATYSGPDTGAVEILIPSVISPCTGCTQGKYSTTSGANNSGVCITCTVGGYSDVQAATSCTLCTAGTYSTTASQAVNSEACIACPDGKYSIASGASVSSTCVSCSTGTYSSTPASSCVSCPAGTYSDTPASSCTLCPAGKFSLATNQIVVAACTSCPANSDANAMRTGCTANLGYYNLDDNLLAYYPFRPDNFYRDASNNGYNLTSTNGASYAPQFESGTGPFPGAGVAFFDNKGTNYAGVTISQAVGAAARSFRVSAGPGLNFFPFIGTAASPGAGFSWSYWIRAADGATAGTINAICWQQIMGYFFDFASTANQIFDYRNCASDPSQMSSEVYISSASRGIASSNGVITRNWVHYCVTIQGRTVKMYPNCASSACTPVSITLTVDPISVLYSVVLIGQGAWSTAFYGWFSDFRLYRKALTAAEVFAVRSYASTTAFSVNETSALLAYYPFSSGNIYNDASGNGYALTDTNPGYSPTYAGGITAPFPGAGVAYLDNRGTNFAGVQVTTSTFTSPAKTFLMTVGSGLNLYSMIGTSAAPGPGFSFCAWIRGADGATSGTLSTINYQGIFQFWATWTGNPLNFFRFQASGSGIILDNFVGSAGTSGGRTAIGGTTFTGKYTNSWTHHCYVYQGRLLKAYFDCSSSTCASVDVTFTADLVNTLYPYVLLGQGAWDWAFFGWLSDVRYYRKALTSAEVFAVKSYDGTSMTAINSVNSGLLAYYPFHPNAFLADASGVSGSLTNTGTVVSQAGSMTDLQNVAYFAQAGGIAGTTSSKQFFTLPSITLGPFFSICLWYNPDSTTGSHSRLISLNTGTSQGIVDIRRDTTSNSLAIEMSNAATCISTGGTVSATGCGSIFSGLFQMSAWQHVCLTVTGTSGKLYYNGAQAGTIALTNQKTVTTYGSAYLAFNPWNNDLYRGQLDEVRIYSRAISASEVTSIYNFRGDTFAPAVLVPCQPCPAGSYRGGACISDGTTGCNNCTAGTYLTGTGFTSASACVACGTGTYSAVVGALTSATCAACPAGTYGIGTGLASSSSCTACGAGTYSATLGAGSILNCTGCGAGTYSAILGASSSLNCTGCGAGTYSAAVGAISSLTCTACGAGTYSATLRASSSSTCIACGAGTYSATLAASSSLTCIACPTGSYSPTLGANSSSACSGCMAGLFWNASRGGCSACLPGSYTTGLGLPSCTLCLAGQYNPTAGGTNCTNCSAGTYSTGTGVGACIACLPGTFLANPGGVGCSNCQQGFYVGQTGGIACLACPLNSNSGAGASTCTANAGYYNMDSSLMAYYTFNPGELLRDTSNLTGALTTSASSPTSQALGAFGANTYNAFLSDATQQYFILPPLKLPNEMSICSWFYMSSGTYRHSNNVWDFGNGYLVYNVFLGLDNAGTGLQAVISDSMTVKTIANGVLDTNVWKHACLTVSGTNANLWYNGGSNPYTLSSARVYDQLLSSNFIGNSNYGPGDSWNGGVDEFRIYTKALSSSEVAALYAFRGDTYSPMILMQCPPCSAGSYGACLSSGALSCTTCLAGTFSTGTGMITSATCSQCTAGTYGSTAGVSACTNCTAGTYSGTTGAQSSLACTLCGTGTYSTALRAIVSSTCLPCSSGTYGTGTGRLSSAACTACSAGLYVGQTGTSVCVSCPQNSYSGAGASVCTPNTGYYNMDSSLMAYYTFNPGELLRDTSGVTGALTASASSPTSQVSGAFGASSYSAFLTGSASTVAANNQYFQMPQLKLPNSMSLCSWFWISPLITRGYNRVWDFGLGPDNENVLMFIDASSTTLRTSTRKGAAASTIADSSIANGAPASVWKHVCLTISGTAGNFWLDGVSQAFTMSNTRNFDTLLTLNYIGKSNFVDYYWYGAFDDFRIYTKALTSSEVAALYAFRGDTYSPMILMQCPPCSAGSYGACLANGSLSCTTCLAGSYSTGTGMITSATCSQCTAGTYGSTTGVTACTNCTAGTYSGTAGAQSSLACILCGVGTYSTVSGAIAITTCQTCSAGTYATGTGAPLSSACLLCSAGKYGTGTGTTISSVCLLCSSGTYLTGTGAPALASCITCSAGTYGTGTGATVSSVCLLCSAGKYLTGTGAPALANCTSCSAGTYGTGTGATVSSVCLLCSAGKYLTGTGAPALANCTSCSAGTYGTGTGTTISSVCLLCSAGKYLTGTGAPALANCTSCSAGTYGTGTGTTVSSVCLLCPAGTYLTGTGAPALANCTTCSAGTYGTGTGTTVSSVCLLCPAGTYLTGTGAPALANCTSCSAGTYGTGTGATVSSVCQNCFGGSYSAGLGMQTNTTCTLCGPGTYSTILGQPSIAGCTQCGAGTYSTVLGAPKNLTCSPCSAGTYSAVLGAVANTTCSSCPAGKFSTSSGGPAITICQDCLAGTYATGTGLTNCSSCAPGTYSSTPAATDSSPCQNCLAGTFSSVYGNPGPCPDCPNSAYSSADRATACTACAPGYWGKVILTGLASTTCISCAYGSLTPGCLSCPGNMQLNNNLADLYATWCVANVGYYAGASPSPIPAYMTGAITTLNGVTYTANASSYLAGNEPYKAFAQLQSTATANNGWTANVSSYETTGASNGNYKLSETTNIEGISAKGEWIQLQTSKPVMAWQYSIVANILNSTRAPRSIYLAGSLDGSTWMYIDGSTVPAATAGSINTLYSLSYSNPVNYSYFRLIVSKIGSSQGILSFDKFRLYEYGIYQCQQGTYATGLGLTSVGACISCATGTYSTGLGMTAASACGTCGVGTYTDTANGGTACSSCPAGKYSTISGAGTSMACQDCFPGTYASTIGLTGCTPCTPGTYSPTPAAANLSACQNCLAGTYASATGLTNCTSCVPGTYSPTLAATDPSVCQNCLAGTYSSAYGRPGACVNCPDGVYSPGDRATACTACTSGSWGMSLVYVGLGPATTCTSCAGGDMTPGCLSCPANMQLNNNLADMVATWCVANVGYYVGASTSFMPAYMTGTTTTLDGVTYIASASSYLAGNEPYKAFSQLQSNSTANNGWTSDYSSYSTSNGVYYGGVSTNIDGYLVMGDWIQLQISRPIMLWQISISANILNPTRAPRYIDWAGSVDGFNWIGLSGSLPSHSVPLATAGSTYTSFLEYSFPANFSYYRMVVSKIGSSQGVLSLDKLRLYDYGIFQCRAGTYATGLGLTSAGGCSKCLMGTYSTGLGMTAALTCQSCGMGTYSTGQGMTIASTCQSCGIGTYADFLNSSVCTACPANSNTSSQGAFQRGNCTCSPGFSGDLSVANSTCSICPANSYCAGLLKFACPSNTFSPAQSSLQSHCRCNAGYQCRYGRDVQLVLRFNLTLSAFAAQEATLRAQIAGLAGVPVSSVYLQSSVVASRRLLELTARVGGPSPADSTAMQAGGGVHARPLDILELKERP